jgi:hypothetical protein
MDSATSSQVDIATSMDAQLASIKQEILESNITVTVTSYMNDGDFIAMNFVASGEADNVTSGIALTVTTTSVDQAKFYQIKFHLFEGDKEFMNQYGSLYISDDFISGKLLLNSIENEPVFTATLNCDLSEADKTAGELAFSIYNADSTVPETVLVLFNQARTDSTADTGIKLFYGSGTASDVRANLAAMSLISFNINTVSQPDSGYFTDLQAATPDTSVQLLTMTDTELAAYQQAVQQSVTMAMLTVMQYLPADLSNALMQSMGMFQ